MNSKAFTTELLFGIFIFFGCSRHIYQQPSVIPASNFQSIVDGKDVNLYTIKNGCLTMQVCNYGGRVVTLFVPDKTGQPVDIVLGHDSLKPYINYKHERVLGACVGPVANRIVGATFCVDGKSYHLAANHGGKGTLHGGFKGLDSQVWDVTSVCDTAITLHYLHVDGQEGFPGNLDIQMTYTLTHNNVFRIDYHATTDKTRPVNISNHPYFNLTGQLNDTIDNYIMTINADSFIGIQGLDILPDPIPVAGTTFDYRTPHAVHDALISTDQQIKNGRGIDHNFCINQISTKGLTFDASVLNPSNGIYLEVYSDQPGLQVCTGQYIKGDEMGKYGKPMRYHTALILETQKWPDAPNKPNFPNTYLHPGETYHHTCEYRFSVKK